MNVRKNIDQGKPRGRPVYSAGPIVRTVELVSVLSGLLAVAALIFALTNFSDRLDIIQQSRRAAATDTCYILRTLVIAAYGPAHSVEALALLDSTGLGNCQAFGRRAITVR